MRIREPVRSNKPVRPLNLAEMIRIMQRFLIVLTAFALAAPSLGCRLCAHPYDYCGPTSIAGRFQPCDPCARAGSILSPGPQYVPGQMVPDEHAENPLKNPN